MPLELIKDKIKSAISPSTPRDPLYDFVKPPPPLASPEERQFSSSQS